MSEEKYLLSVFRPEMSDEEFSAEMEKLRIIRDLIYEEISTEGCSAALPES